jgi:MFS family permease
MTQIVTPELPEKAKLLQNFYNVVGVYGAIWIIFHLTSVFFFGFIVGSPLLVGIFLGIWNIWSMIIDVPLGTIQRHVASKTMLAIANALMIIAAIIFLYLVRVSGDLGFSLSGGIIEITRTFLTTGVNFMLLLLVGILYGTIKEIYDITTISYLLNHCDPSEYDRALSRNNIAMGIGSVTGILLSIVILSLRTDSTQLILFVLIFLIVCVSVFIQNYFDNSHEVFNLGAVKNLHIIEKTKTLEKNTASYFKNTVSTMDFEKLKWSMDYIVMKPKEITGEIDWWEIVNKTKVEYRMLYKLIIEKTSFVPILLWSTGCILLFGCWDTIVTTFFVTFLDEALKNSGAQNIIRSGFILIGILAIPAYALQMFWIKKADMYGKFTIITLGIFLSAVALFGLAITGQLENLIGLCMLVGFGMLNSTGYAAGYPMSQSIFADEYNKSYARITESNVINADVSAAPLKILNNFANAIGLIFWGALISFIGFSGMFIIYGSAVLAWGIVSLKKKISWGLEKG